jgi:hypothetical protein
MPLNSILDSAITRRLARYLEMSDASSGFSDVVVKDGHITVHHAFAKLEPANELLRARRRRKRKRRRRRRRRASCC